MSEKVRPTVAQAFQILPAHGYTVFPTKGKHKAVNGEAEGIGIAKDLTLEICRVKLPWDELRYKHKVIDKLPVVFTPDGECDLYYRCEQSSALELLAADEAGFPIVETLSWAVTYPTPGYNISGQLTKEPTIPVSERESLRAVLKMFDKRPPVAELAKQLLPARKDIMPAPGADFPPITDENFDLIHQTTKVTEDNIALIFEARYKKELRYCDTWSRWLQWDSIRWQSERTLLAFDYSRNISRKMNLAGAVSPAKASFARGVEFFCRASRTFATESKQWDSDVMVFNMPEGTMNLRSGELYAHRQEDYITKVANVTAKEGPHPLFDMFLRDITLNDPGLPEYLQRALGACLSGAIQDNFLLFFYGTGQNGKNTFGDLITWILGDYAKVIPIETLIANKNASHPTTLANLRGLRLAVCSEVSEGSYWDESRVKSLTGDTEISARFMRQDFFEFARTHKHLVYGNHRPMLRIVDPGMKARLHIVPFKAYFPPDARDPEMRMKLQAEAPAILYWLVEGHRKWLEDGYLKKCSAVQAETESYFEAQSTNEAWIEECCREGNDFQASAKELYTSFKQFKEARGEGVLSQARWGEWMNQRMYDKYKSHGTVWYRGIDLKPQSVLDFRA